MSHLAATAIRTDWSCTLLFAAAAGYVLRLTISESRKILRPASLGVVLCLLAQLAIAQRSEMPSMLIRLLVIVPLCAELLAALGRGLMVIMPLADERLIIRRRPWWSHLFGMTLAMVVLMDFTHYMVCRQVLSIACAIIGLVVLKDTIRQLRIQLKAWRFGGTIPDHI